MFGASIAGLKYSAPLSMVRLPGAKAPDIGGFVSALAAERINVAFLSAGQAWGLDPWACFCVLVKDGPRAIELARQWWSPTELIEPVVSLTIYPANHSLKLPASIMAALNRLQITPLALGTSPGAVVTVIDYPQMEHAVQGLAKALNLPKGVKPGGWGFSVNQTPKEPG